MGKTLKNTFQVLCILVLTGMWYACKSKKSIPPDASAAQGNPTQSAQYKTTKFGYQYINACSQRMKGNLKEALVLFEECKTLEPANVAVNYELGTIYKLLGENEKALTNAKICASAEQKNEWYQLLLVDCYNANKQYNLAIKIRENLVKNFPNRNEFKEELAIEYAVTGQYDKSFKLYEQLEKNYGINEQLTLNKVKLLKSQKKYNEAEVELKRLLETNKSEARFYSYLADLYQELNDLEKAKSMFDKIVEVDPNNPTVNLALHDYYSAKGNVNQAHEYLIKAFQNPELDGLTKSTILVDYYKRATQGDSKSLTQALELAKISVSIHPTLSECNAIYADLLRLHRNESEAVKYYYLAAQNETRNYRIWENLILTDNELGLYDSLEHHSAKAMELFPSLPILYLYNGVANSQLKNYNKAVQSLRNGLEFVLDQKGMMLDFLRALGDNYNTLKEYEKSDKAFDDALKIDSDNTYVLNNYAYYLSLRKENFDKAEKYSKRSIELQPNNRSYMDTYGWILFQQKKYKEAEIWLAKAAKTEPKDPTLLEHYGDVLYKLNKVDEAVLRWNEAKEAGGKEQTLLKKISQKKLDD